MENSILSSPIKIDHKPGQQWLPSVRSVVRAMRRDGHTYGQIKLKTGLERSSIQRILKAPSSANPRLGKVFKPKSLKQKDIRRIFMFVS